MVLWGGEAYEAEDGDGEAPDHCHDQPKVRDEDGDGCIAKVYSIQAPEHQNKHDCSGAVAPVFSDHSH